MFYLKKKKKNKTLKLGFVEKYAFYRIISNKIVLRALYCAEFFEEELDYF